MIEYLFLSILKVSASAAIVILLLFILTPFLNKRYFMKWKYRIWLLLSAYLCLPVNYAEFYRQISRLHNVEPVSVPAVTSVAHTVMVTLNQPELTAQKTAETFKVIHALPSPLTVFSSIWLSGVVILFLLHMTHYFLYKRKIRQNALPLMREDYLRILKMLLKDIDIQRDIETAVWSGTGSPMIIGIFKPVLVLPNEDYSVEEIYFILKHELLHYRGHDIYGKLFFLVAKTIHWFNPIVSLMYKEAVIDMELSCDERVVWNETNDVKKAYAETLFLSLARQNKTEAYFSTQFQGGTKIMKKRFQNILLKTKKRNGRILLTAVFLLILVLGTLAGCSETQTAHEDTSTLPGDENTESSETGTSYLANAVEEQKPFITDAILTLNAFAIAYFTEDAAALTPYLTDSYPYQVDTYPYGQTFADASLLTFDEIQCSIAGGTKEVPKVAFLGVSDDKIETEYDNLLISGINMPVPDHPIEDGYTLIFSIPLKAAPYKEIDLDYREYLTVEMTLQDGDWKVQSYGLEL